MESASLRRFYRPGLLCNSISKGLAPGDEHVPDLEWLGEQPELGVDEAEGAVKRDRGVWSALQGALHVFDLAGNSVGQGRSVSAPDGEVYIRAEQTALVDLSHQTVIALRIDDPHAARRNHHVVNVGLRARYLAVVQS